MNLIWPRRDLDPFSPTKNVMASKTVNGFSTMTKGVEKYRNTVKFELLSQPSSRYVIVWYTWAKSLLKFA